MKQSPLTVVVNILPAHRAGLRALLTGMGRDVAGNPYLRFAEIGATHFARFVIIPGPGLEPGQDGPERLLFTSNHDGPWPDYIDRLLQQAGEGVEAIWSKCEGYPALSRHDPAFAARFKEFIAAHSYPVQAFFQAYPGPTVGQVHAAGEVRRQIENWLSSDRAEAVLKVLGRLPVPPPTPGQRVQQAARRIIDPLVRFLLREVVLKFFERLLGPRITHAPTEAPSQDVNTHPEDTDWLNTVQNEMTVVSAIVPERLGKLRLFFGVVRLAVKFNPTPGALLGISTIHFARWVILDDGQTLLFESNYDGNWEQYIGDFVDKASGGMDAIWGSYPRYPSRGARDLQAFKRVIMDNQVRALFFYSAYPDRSVRNVLNDLAVSHKLSRLTGQPDMAELLRRL